MIRSFLICTLLAAIVMGCDSTSDKPADDGVKFISFENEEFKLSFPSDWSDVTANYPGLNFVIVAPPDEKTDRFPENVSVAIQPIGDTLTMDRFLEVTEQQMAKYLPDYVMIEKNTVQKNNMDCLVLEYQATQKDKPHRYIQNVYIYFGKAYIVTFTAEQIIFNEYRKTGEKILNSFVLKH